MYVVKELKQDTEYVIKVAAETESGSGSYRFVFILFLTFTCVGIPHCNCHFISGPWSSEFVGKTLASTPTTLHSTLLWSGPDGLLQTDLTGDNLKTLIHRYKTILVHGVVCKIEKK